jgi:hypothetical protein
LVAKPEIVRWFDVQVAVIAGVAPLAFNRQLRAQ